MNNLVPSKTTHPIPGCPQPFLPFNRFTLILRITQYPNFVPKFAGNE